jgi:hypothetical protein
MMISLSATVLSGKDSPRTLKIQGSIQNMQILVLLDSGSSHSFLSEQVTIPLQGVSSSYVSSKVKLANGGFMQSVSHMVNAEWFLQGYKFCSDLKILPLQSFDMVVGMNWLEQHSPLKIHWTKKWLTIPYQNTYITLHGIVPGMVDCHMVVLFHLSAVTVFDNAESIPVEVQSVLDHFQGVFEPPTKLPPRRACDHRIPLIPGATPVSSRPYRYASALKDEMKKQVAEMLQVGIIHPSSSPFSSPALLVKKKDGSWRFCIDYRGLNNITVKGKFPLPVIDELMDELSSSRWFSKLNLRAGYHLICLAPGEEYKTTFQTHSCHYELRSWHLACVKLPTLFKGL